MYDSFEPFQRLNIIEFNFKPNRYEVWKAGQKVDFGNTSDLIVLKEHQTISGTKAILNFNDSNLFSQLTNKNEFDIFMTSSDRLQLLKIPSSGNGDDNMGISMFKMTIGSTRNHTDFQSNEPYCCNLFIQNGSIAKLTFSFSSPEKLIEFYADAETENDDVEFVFHSSDHIRYENGVRVSGPHGSAPRAIQVEPSITGGEGMTVTVFNTENGAANVQMAPKQMKVKSRTDNKIELIGFGNDSMGFSFKDYGFTIFHNQGAITKCVLHMFDRNVDIEYLE